MVKFKNSLSIVAMMVAVAGVGVMQPVHAAQSGKGDSLLLRRVQQEKSMNLPHRGLTMRQVEKKWGAPQRKLPPRGGDSKLHPLINRWEYRGFIVYFEHDHVIHSVLNTPAGNNTDPSAAH